YFSFKRKPTQKHRPKAFFPAEPLGVLSLASHSLICAFSIKETEASPSKQNPRLASPLPLHSPNLTPNSHREPMSTALTTSARVAAGRRSSSLLLFENDTGRRVVAHVGGSLRPRRQVLFPFLFLARETTACSRTSPQLYYGGSSSSPTQSVVVNHHHPHRHSSLLRDQTLSKLSQP
ncbi:hypothetical protein V8G54_001272, partial [Vigna mungo]